LDHFHLDVQGLVCADLGSNVGGFVDCLLQRGAAKVYSVDTSYGTLAWKLRKDPRVVVLERVNAMHVDLPEPVDLVTIDVGWTPQGRILPSAAKMLRPGGRALSLIKPHYEAPRRLLREGVLPDESVGTVVDDVLRFISAEWRLLGSFPSPVRGQGGNQEVFALLQWGGAAGEERPRCPAESGL
jgi:23S rRNA (cytidine1920-2'-O)/16S rRNA (cytidine1409-2'-O)-methyltransferase